MARRVIVAAVQAVAVAENIGLVVIAVGRPLTDMPLRRPGVVDIVARHLGAPAAAVAITGHAAETGVLPGLA